MVVGRVSIKSFMRFDIAPAGLFLERSQRVKLCNQIHGDTPGPTPETAWELQELGWPGDQVLILKVCSFLRSGSKPPISGAINSFENWRFVGR